MLHAAVCIPLVGQSHFIQHFPVKISKENNGMQSTIILLLPILSAQLLILYSPNKFCNYFTSMFNHLFLCKHFADEFCFLYVDHNILCIFVENYIV